MKYFKMSQIASIFCIYSARGIQQTINIDSKMKNVKRKKSITYNVISFDISFPIFKASLENVKKILKQIAKITFFCHPAMLNEIAFDQSNC